MVRGTCRVYYVSLTASRMVQMAKQDEDARRLAQPGVLQYSELLSHAV